MANKRIFRACVMMTDDFDISRSILKPRIILRGTRRYRLVGKNYLPENNEDISVEETRFEVNVSSCHEITETKDGDFEMILKDISAQTLQKVILKNQKTAKEIELTYRTKLETPDQKAHGFFSIFI